MMGIVQSFR